MKNLNVLMLASTILMLNGCFNEEKIEIEKFEISNKNLNIVSIDGKTIASKYEIIDSDISVSEDKNDNYKWLNNKIYVINNKNGSNIVKSVNLETKEISTVTPFDVDYLCLKNDKILFETKNIDKLNKFIENNKSLSSFDVKNDIKIVPSDEFKIKNIDGNFCKNSILVKEELNNFFEISSVFNSYPYFNLVVNYDNYTEISRFEDKGRVYINIESEKKDGKIDISTYSMDLSIREKINFNDYFMYNKMIGEINKENITSGFQVGEYIYVLEMINKEKLEIKNVRKIKINFIEDKIFNKGIKLNRINKIKDGFLLTGKFLNKDLILKVDINNNIKFVAKSDKINEIIVNSDECNIIFSSNIDNKNTLKISNVCE